MWLLFIAAFVALSLLIYHYLFRGDKRKKYFDEKSGQSKIKGAKDKNMIEVSFYDDIDRCKHDCAYLKNEISFIKQNLLELKRLTTENEKIIIGLNELMGMYNIFSKKLEEIKSERQATNKEKVVSTGTSVNIMPELPSEFTTDKYDVLDPPSFFIENLDAYYRNGIFKIIVFDDVYAELIINPNIESQKRIIVSLSDIITPVCEPFTSEARIERVETLVPGELKRVDNQWQLIKKLVVKIIGK